MSLRFEFRLFLFWCWMILSSDGVPRNRIIGGRPALPGALPSVVAIMRTKNRVFCGGTLVSSTHVLSAAHCFVHFRSLGKVTVMAGDVDRTKTTTNTRQSLEVKKVTSHPKFVLKTFENDYCVLEVSKAVLNRNVQIIRLAEKRPRVRTICTIAGWGYTDEDAISFNDVLMRTDVLVQNCGDSPLKVNGENMLCAGVDYGGIDSCQGDSGGPLFCNGEIAGIISFGKGCAIAGFYGVYADVAHAREWIYKTMGLNPRKLNNKQSGKASKQLKISAEKLMLSPFVIFYLSKVLATAHA